jgi:hypothetical protein
MAYQSYLRKCEELLTDFEKSQLHMLRLNLNEAGVNFLIQMKLMRQFFKQILKELDDHSFDTDRDKILLTKQIKRLLVFLKEMDLHILGFQTNPPPDEIEIIFIFERQHLFKNIYRKHLNDFTSIINLV